MSLCCTTQPSSQISELLAALQFCWTRVTKVHAVNLIEMRKSMQLHLKSACEMKIKYSAISLHEFRIWDILWLEIVRRKQNRNYFSSDSGRLEANCTFVWEVKHSRKAQISAIWRLEYYSRLSLSRIGIFCWRILPSGNLSWSKSFSHKIVCRALLIRNGNSSRIKEFRINKSYLAKALYL